MRDEPKVERGVKAKKVKPPKVYGLGRKCEKCGRALCVYDPGPNCYQHTWRKPPSIRGDNVRPR